MTAIYQRIFFLALVAFLLPLAAYGQPSPGYVRQALPEATLVGQGMFRWFGLSVYKARLWGDKAKVTATGWPASSFALELEYTRKIEGEDIAIASIDEIPEQASRFFLDGKLIGEIDDPEFGPAFFSIWLHPKTSAPKLRRLLLNTK